MVGTRIVPYLEVNERLAALDMVNPVIDRDRVEHFFLSFITSLKIRGTIPPIRWLPGIHDWRARLLDMNIYMQEPDHYSPWRVNLGHYNSAISIALKDRHPDGLQALYRTLLERIASGPWLSQTWRQHPRMLCDSNILQAFEFGLGFFILSPVAIILIPRPGFRTRDEQPALAITSIVLNSTIGPAVHFPDDELSDQYWIRGERVPRFVVEQPQRITRAHIRAAHTPRMRRVLIDQYGLIKYSIESGFKEIDRDEKHGVILYARGGNRAPHGLTERRCVVELINATPEPDGQHRHFGRRVPGNMQSAHRAVAWTFGFNDPNEYHPAVQT